MTRKTIAVVGTGDMGSAVGAAFARSGYRVITDLTERSAASRALAARAGLEDLGSLTAVVGTADVFLSIVPPAQAAVLAERVLAAAAESRARPVFVDCNAISPATLLSLAAPFARSGRTFIDVGIIGPAPRPSATPTRFYVSGEGRAPLLELDVPEILVIDMGPELGRASAIKMVYAAMNKGVDALYTAVLMAAEELGVRAELMKEFRESQTQAAERMAARVPYLAATAERYTGEMREIAATFAAVGVTPDFHRGAEWVYAELAKTPLAAETRATQPAQRSLDEALAIFCAALPKR
jgi:3-hydroxyisobutyrate dehydrogenase-like beta-hydroxyacid dehydrogenase